MGFSGGSVGKDACNEGDAGAVGLSPGRDNPMEGSTPDFPVHPQLPKLAQTHAHRVSDAIEPSHPLLSPSPLALNLSQHQGLFL